MQWIEQNRKDVEVLKRVDLSLLDPSTCEGDELLMQRIQGHNKAITDLTERFKKLAKDREAIANADHWLDRDSKEVLTERHRLLAESWDVLVALRKWIQDRKGILRALEDVIADQMAGVEGRYAQAFDKAEKALSRQHHSYLKTEPGAGSAYVEDLAEEDEAVVELRAQIDQLRAVLNTLQGSRYRAGQDSVLTFRQREVYEQLN